MTLIEKTKRLANSSNTVGVYAPVKLHVSTSSSEWNKLAIEFVIEAMKPPTQRKQLSKITSFLQRDISRTSVNLTTDDWNKLALSLVASDNKKEKI